MNVSLVYDGSAVRIPSEMGEPSVGQMQGTPAEQLSELCSRVCYDSLGSGRSSVNLHRHILEVGHLSVYRHATFTVGIIARPPQEALFLQSLANRKGVWIEIGDTIGGHARVLEITINLQAVIEWGRHTRGVNFTSETEWLGDVLRRFAFIVAPRVAPEPFVPLPAVAFLKSNGLSEDQAHVSLFMSGSRGFSHEQVRHNYAVSQRSTRYVDESGSAYQMHPLVFQFLDSLESGRQEVHRLFATMITQTIDHDNRTYDALVDVLQLFMLNKGVDKLTARKQARGAARGYLGNALTIELIFTAPVSGWKDMLRQRATRFADAEIRQIYTSPTGVLTALKASRYWDMFSDFHLEPSPDGLGSVLAS